MRLLILSDLHLEVWRERIPNVGKSAGTPDVVILAGDIHTRSRAPGWAAKTFPGIPVVYVAGNHEYYGEAIESAGQAILQECKLSPNINYLDCNEYILNGIRFLGVTLWTDFLLFGHDHKSRAMSEAQATLNDYRRIKVAADGYRKLRPQDTARLHAVQKSWLERKLGEPFVGHTVVVTHMAPSMCSISAEYSTDPISAAFASNLDDLVMKADLWVHGHTHSSSDYQLGKCRVVANPLGYLMRNGRPENGEFDPNCIILLNAKDRLNT
jgi:DNA repair exonuclease SbcCD nuclease subunit